MLNFFKKRPNKIHKHRYKNLLIALPSHWEYELEEGDQQACYDPKSQSTLRINILRVTPPQPAIDLAIEALTDHRPYLITPKGYLLVNPIYVGAVESGKNITLVTWKLINHKPVQKLIAVLTYTVLSSEIESAQEKQIISLIENSLQDAELA